MYKVLLIWVLLLGWCVNIYAQFNFDYKNDTLSTYFWTAKTSFHSLVATDSAYYVTGIGLDSNHTGIYETGLFLKIDTNGQVIAQQLLGTDTIPILTERRTLITTQDGHFVVGADYDQDAALLKINDLGDTIWMKVYLTADTLQKIEPSRVIETTDKGFLLTCRRLDFGQSTLRDVLIKTDSSGNELWRRVHLPPPNYRSAPLQVLEEDSDIITVRQRSSGNSSLDWGFQLHTHIEKVDALGNTIWSYITPSNRYIALWDMIPTTDKGYVFCGTEGIQRASANGNLPIMRYRGYIGKIDSTQQLVWERTMGVESDNILYNIKSLPNGDIIGVGKNIQLFPENSTIFTMDSLYHVGWMVKISADGDSLWERGHRKHLDLIRPEHYFREVEILSDGRLLVAGYIENTYIPSPTRGDYGWLVRTDSLGCIVPGCQLLTNTENIAMLFDNEVTVYPNPASEVVHFRFDKGLTKKAVIRVYLGLGQLVGQTALPLPQTEAQINVSAWNSGAYYYGVYVEGRLVQQGQIFVGR